MCWKSLPGGGFLVSKSWSFSDPHSLYLYPDCRTALLGSFIGERLEVAREAEVRLTTRSSYADLCSGGQLCHSGPQQHSRARGVNQEADRVYMGPSLQ